MSARDIEDMTIEKFKFWTVPSLKDYLKRRNISCVGNKDMLVARAFAVWEMKITEVETACQIAAKLDEEYRTLLITPDEGHLPDLFSKELKGWEGEKDGMSSWPPTMMEDISSYLSTQDRQTGKASLSQRLLSDYKDQKAYSYISSNWLFEISYNVISDELSYCFLKALCRPSQRLNDIPHDVWVCILKKSGSIQSAYCTCFAGLGQTCNRVAAVLLKVDFCWQYGYIQKACTLKPCTWLQGGKSVLVVPQKVKDMDIKKPSALKTVGKKKLNTVQKRLFVPQKKEKGMQLDGFLLKLEEISPTSVTLGERKPTRNPVYLQWDKEKERKPSSDNELPPSLSDVATESKTKEDFLGNLQKFDSTTIASIEKETRGQAKNPIWAHQRNDRVTASRFREISTRMDTYKKKKDTDVSPLISRVLGYISPAASLPALKYGRRMEDDAVKCDDDGNQGALLTTPPPTHHTTLTGQHNQYTSMLKEAGHKNVEVREFGLYIHCEQCFIGASPDRIVSCCCGTGVLEVKCPLSCSHGVPTVDTVDCLIQKDGKCCLNPNHKYFDQVQGQMALAGSTLGDFFVYSRHGYFYERISFSNNYWESVLDNLVFFFSNFLAELVARKIQEQVTSQQSCISAGQPNPQLMAKEPTTTASLPSTKRPKRNSDKGKQAAKKRRLILKCGLCESTFLEPNVILSEKDNSIQCDKCDRWYHWPCVGLSADSEELGEGEWICSKCL